MYKLKSKASYTKLTAKQKEEIIEYWDKYLYPFSAICRYFSKKWNQSIKKSTIGDLILQWKRFDSIRGINKIESMEKCINSCVKTVLQEQEEFAWKLSDKIIHCICYGELMNKGFDPSLLCFQQVADALSLYPTHLLSEGVRNSHSEEMIKLQQEFSPSHIFFLDFFHLFYHCIPYYSYCYGSGSKYAAYRDKMEVLLVFSADGKQRFHPVTHGFRFSTIIDSTWHITTHKRGMYDAEDLFSLDILQSK